MKVFLGITDVAGYYSGLRVGFQELNVPCFLFNRNSHAVMAYKGYDENILTKIYRSIFKRRESESNKLIWIFYRSIEIVLGLLITLWVSLSFSCVIMGNGVSLLPLNLDLFFLKLCRKKIIYIFHGSDCRPPFVSFQYLYKDYPTIYEMTAEKKKMIARIEKVADYIINIQGQALMQKRKFILWYHLGTPIRVDSEILNQITKKTAAATIKILHCPSNPKIKGTKRIRTAIQELKEEGYKIDYQEITGRPHHEVLAALNNCDLVIDELFSDTFMAAFATEAATFEKPAVVGGYHFEALLRDAKKHNYRVPPIIPTDPDDLKNTLSEVLNNPSIISKKGHKAKEYINSYSSPKEVASKFLKIITDDVPENWFFKPQDVEIVLGMGISKFELKKHLKNYKEKYGNQGLFLADNPAAIKKIDAFINA